MKIFKILACVNILLLLVCFLLEAYVKSDTTRIFSKMNDIQAIMKFVTTISISIDIILFIINI